MATAKLSRHGKSSRDVKSEIITQRRDKTQNSHDVKI